MANLSHNDNVQTRVYLSFIMRLKSFTAKSTKEAMQLVREALGDEAVIIDTSEERDALGGMTVHITAAIDNDSFVTETHAQENTAISDKPQRTPDQNWQYDHDSNEKMVIEAITENMLFHTVPEEVLDQIVAFASVMDMEEPRLAMLSAVESLFRYHTIPERSSFDRPLILIGQPGAGKTLATAKLAARGAMNNQSVAVITTDTERAGGVEQLHAFTQLLQVNLTVAKNQTHLKEAILKFGNMDQILIDTAGTNPFNAQDVKKLKQLISAIDAIPVLVMPANIHAEEAAETAAIFSDIGARYLLPTRVDISRRLGSLLSAAYKGNLSFCDCSATARVADGLSRLSPKKLTQLLMPNAQNVKIERESKAG